MDTIVLDTQRTLRVSAAEARVAIIRSLRAQQFMLTTEQVSLVAAKRGSQIVGSVQPKKLPVTVKVTLHPTEGGCTASIHIADAWRSPLGGKVWGMNGPYRVVLDEIQAELDAALTPHAHPATPFASGTVTTATNEIAVLAAANGAFGRAGGAAADRVDELLTPTGPHVTSKALKEVVLRSTRGVASFDRVGIEGLLTVGLLVSSKPGSMPAHLANDVERLSSKLEMAVARQPGGRVMIDLDDNEIPVVEFLAVQSAIRETLPLRTLHVCTTCKLEKVVNPDYAKLQEKNRRKRVLTGAVGATISSSGISPFLLVGSFLKLKNFDIPFVCPRCQGLDSDSSVITYCPNCGERRDECALRTCGRCKYNFGAMQRAKDGEMWSLEPLPLAPPAIAAAVSPRPLAPPSSAAPHAAWAPPAP